MNTRSALIAFASLSLVAACSSSNSNNAPDGGSKPGIVGACTKPKYGLYMGDMKITKACPWWSNDRTFAQLRISDDSVQYPHADDVCGDIQWNGCNVSDQCSPMKLNSGGDTGWIGRGTMNLTFTDDTHVTGTLKYENGSSCAVELDVTAEWSL